MHNTLYIFSVYLLVFYCNYMNATRFKWRCLIFMYILSYINLAFDYVVVMSFTSNVIKVNFFVGARH
jgi:hypothetical protein